MIIKQLELVNFRNYENQKVDFGSGVNVLYGDNAQGKTNLLEAVYVCAIGKSHRAVPDREMIRQGAEFAYITAQIHATGRDYTVECRFDKDKRKQFKINGVGLERTSELIGMFNAVLFTPDDLNLIGGSPSLRRRLLDIFISQLRPVYLSSLINYNKALEQKQRLLRSVDNKPSLADTLDVWNAELARYGAVIVKYRDEYVKKLSLGMGEAHREITDGEEFSIAEYVCSFKLPQESEGLENALYDELKRSAKRELEQKSALVGPHRDDLLFYVKGDRAKNFSSRGQCRTVVLSLRLAQLEVFKKERGEYPVLLLDDMTGELDEGRRKFLLEKVRGMQAVITCTDAGLFAKGEGVGFYRVDSGTVNSKQ